MTRRRRRRPRKKSPDGTEVAASSEGGSDGNGTVASHGHSSRNHGQHPRGNKLQRGGGKRLRGGPRKRVKIMPREGPTRDILLAFEDTKQSFDPELIERARNYTGAVRFYKWDSTRRAFTIAVQGSASQPYVVTIRVPDILPSKLKSECSCPYSAGYSDCKHIYAALETVGIALADPADPLQKAYLSSSAPADWALQLAELDKIINPVTEGRRMVPTHIRTVWRVEVRYGRLDLHPYEQTLTRDRWTGGRPLSFDKFAESRDHWTTAKDEAIAKLVKPVQVSSGLRTHGTSFDLDAFEAIEHLVDHENVYREDLPERSIRVIKKPPTFAVRHAKEGGLSIRIAIDGNPISDNMLLDLRRQGALIFDERTDTLTVMRLDERIQKILDALSGGNAQFPEPAKDELMRRVPFLEAMIPVSLPPDLMGESVASDHRLRVRLSSLGRLGLVVELRYKPVDGASVSKPGEGSQNVTGLRHGKRVIANRNLLAECKLASQVSELLPLPRELEDSPWTWTIEDPDQALEFVQALARRDEYISRANGVSPADVVIEWAEGSARMSVTREADSSFMNLAIKEHHDWFGVEGELAIDGVRVNLATLVDNIRKGKKFIPVGDGQFVALTKELREKLMRFGDVARGGRGGMLEANATSAPILSDLFEVAGEFESCDRWDSLKMRLESALTLNPMPPATLTAELREYQIDGYRWLARLAAWGVGGCLADDMGLGKTIQALALLIDRAKLGPCLVVSPMSVGFNWAREIKRFAPTLNPILYRDTDRHQDLRKFGEGDVVIASYGLVTKDRHKLRNVQFATLILDEAQYIKNARTQMAHACRELQADWKCALTGTPVENSLAELWSLFRVISPGLFGGFDSFRSRYIEPIEKRGDHARRMALSRVVRPFILRRVKSEVLEQLPPKTEVRLEAVLSGRERQLYDIERMKALHDLGGADGGPRTGRIQVLAALTRLRQMSCHPRLVYDEERELVSAKMHVLMQTISELKRGRHRALVFSQFVRLLDVVREMLDERGVDYCYLDGSTPHKERENQVNAFQSGKGDLFLISLKAGGTGLNLTAADYVIHLDPWWNPAVEDQASDRAHRIGQTRPVTIYRIVARDTIEDKILALHEDKRDLVAGILEGTDRAGKLTNEELIALIAGEDRPAAIAVESTEGEEEAKDQFDEEADDDLEEEGAFEEQPSAKPDVAAPAVPAAKIASKVGRSEKVIPATIESTAAAESSRSPALFRARNAPKGPLGTRRTKPDAKEATNSEPPAPPPAAPEPGGDLSEEMKQRLDQWLVNLRGNLSESTIANYKRILDVVEKVIEDSRDISYANLITLSANRLDVGVKNLTASGRRLFASSLSKLYKYFLGESLISPEEEDEVESSLKAFRDGG
ncbi:MAG: DEAD/DEAH box helicase [Planctomycetes bacterium]|nr:DEAD/DEAH box helicase [Planctomycetota bacterium]